MVLRVAGKLPVADSRVVFHPEALARNLLRVRPSIRQGTEAKRPVSKQAYALECRSAFRRTRARGVLTLRAGKEMMRRLSPRARGNHDGALRSNRYRANMVMVDLDIPPGFDLLSEDLEEYQEKSARQKGGRLEKFNLTATGAVLYFDSFAPGQTVSLRFRLRAKYPVRVMSKSRVRPGNKLGGPSHRAGGAER